MNKAWDLAQQNSTLPTALIVVDSDRYSSIHEVRVLASTCVDF